MPEPNPALHHGGALVEASLRFGMALADWLDLSTGINPFPYPLGAIDPTALTRLPDPSDLAALIIAARAAYGVPDDVSIVAVPGSDIAIRLLPLAAPAGDVAILSPTYSAHEEAWRAAGRGVTAVRSLAEAERAGSIVVLANPNNPDGKRYDPESLLVLASRLASCNGLLVVDEAFADLAPERSVVSELSARSIVVLRSFGKFYGLAGLRLGFLIGAPALVDPIGRMLGNWPISGPAITAGRGALQDQAWQAATRMRLATARQNLERLLARYGLPTIGGTDLFVLVAIKEALAVHEHLARRGIWTRVFGDQPDWLRIGLPTDEGFSRLEAALASP